MNNDFIRDLSRVDLKNNWIKVAYDKDQHPKLITERKTLPKKLLYGFLAFVTRGHYGTHSKGLEQVAKVMQDICNTPHQTMPYSIALCKEKIGAVHIKNKETIKKISLIASKMLEGASPLEKLEKAAKDGIPDARYELGLSLLESKDPEKKEQGIAYLEMATGQSHKEAFDTLNKLEDKSLFTKTTYMTLALFLSDSYDPKKMTEEILPYFDTAAEKGNPRACYVLGLYYEKSSTPEKGIQYFIKGSSQEPIESQNYSHRHCIAKARDAALTLIKDPYGTTGIDAQDFVKLSRVYAKGVEGVKEAEPNTAMGILIFAAKLGSKEAFREIINLDPTTSKQLFIDTIVRGYSEGIGCEQDIDKAISFAKIHKTPSTYPGMEALLVISSQIDQSKNASPIEKETLFNKLWEECKGVKAPHLQMKAYALCLSIDCPEAKKHQVPYKLTLSDGSEFNLTPPEKALFSSYLSLLKEDKSISDTVTKENFTLFLEAQKMGQVKDNDINDAIEITLLSNELGVPFLPAALEIISQRCSHIESLEEAKNLVEGFGNQAWPSEITNAIINPLADYLVNAWDAAEPEEKKEILALLEKLSPTVLKSEIHLFKNKSDLGSLIAKLSLTVELSKIESLTFSEEEAKTLTKSFARKIWPSDITKSIINPLADYWMTAWKNEKGGEERMEILARIKQLFPSKLELPEGFPTEEIDFSDIQELSASALGPNELEFVVDELSKSSKIRSLELYNKEHQPISQKTLDQISLLPKLEILFLTRVIFDSKARFTPPETLDTLDLSPSSEFDIKIINNTKNIRLLTLDGNIIATQDDVNKIDQEGHLRLLYIIVPNWDRVKELTPLFKNTKIKPNITIQ